MKLPPIEKLYEAYSVLADKESGQKMPVPMCKAAMALKNMRFSLMKLLFPAMTMRHTGRDILAIRSLPYG